MLAIPLHIEDDAKSIRNTLLDYIKSGVNKHIAKYIQELDKLLLIVTGYEKFVTNFDVKKASEEHSSVLTLLKILTPVNKLYQKGIDDTAPQNIQDIKVRLKIIVDRLEEIEATLEILSDKNLSKQIREALLDKVNNPKEAFIEWHHKDSK